MIYLVIFVIGVMFGAILTYLICRSRDVGELCMTKENNKDIYYMAIDEKDRAAIPKLHRVSFHVRILEE